MADTVFSIKEKKLRLDKEEDCVDVLGLLRASDQFERVELNGNTISSPAAKVLAEALTRQSRLKEIDISDIFTGRSAEIAPAMSAFRDALLGLPSVVSLSVSDNAFGPDGVRSFIDLLARHPAIRSFNTNNTGLSPEGGRLIANALARRPLSDYDKEGEAGIVAATEPPLALETFIAGRSRLEDGGALALSSVFERMGSLKELRMPQNGIRPKGMKRLAEALAKNPSLEVLDVNDNNIGKGEAAAAFAKTLADLPNLRVINLGDCMLDAKSAALIIQSLSNHTKIQELNLCFSEIDDDTAALLIESVIKKSANLRSLEINGNELHTKGLKAIKTALKELGKESALGSLSDNEGTDESGSDEDASSEENERPAKAPAASTPTSSAPSSAAPTPIKSPASQDAATSELIAQVEKLTI